jgi:hypothetical protein
MALIACFFPRLQVIMSKEPAAKQQDDDAQKIAYVLACTGGYPAHAAVEIACL